MSLKQVAVAPDEAIQINTMEAKLLLVLLNERGNGVGIKDLKLISNLADSIEVGMPKQPEQTPFLPPSIEGADGKKEYTADEQVQNAKIQAENQKKTGDYFKTEFPVTFSSMHKVLLSQRIANFKHFFSDKESRDLVLNLAEKLGANL